METGVRLLVCKGVGATNSVFYITNVADYPKTVKALSALVQQQATLLQPKDVESIPLLLWNF